MTLTGVPGRRPLVAVGLLTAIAVAGYSVTGLRRVDLPTLYQSGVSRSLAGSLSPVPSDTRDEFVPGSSVLEGRHVDRAAVQDSRRWLAAAPVPGGPTVRAMCARALLDLRALTLSNGAVIAGWSQPWRYVWPRDASFAVAALSVTGHRVDAVRAFGYLVRIAPGDGRWHARYLTDGSGRVPDERGLQSDGAGWFLWSAWMLLAAPGANDSAGSADAVLAGAWPQLQASADGIADGLDAEGLPQPSADYWEGDADELTLGIVLPALLGLRSAADLARRAGHAEQARRWSAAAVRLDRALRRTFGTAGYPRTVPDGGPDAISAMLGRPFFADDVATPVVLTAERDLRVANGGVKPGGAWRNDGVAWTPETALFALHYASNGQRARAAAILRWLAGHRTAVGSLPEKVLPNGSPASVAPLSWTAALVVLTAAAQDQALPTPPAPAG